MIKQIEVYVKSHIQAAFALRTVATALLYATLASTWYFYFPSVKTLVGIWIIGVVYAYSEPWIMNRLGRHKPYPAHSDEVLRDCIRRSGVSLGYFSLQQSSITHARAQSFGSQRSVVLTSEICKLPPDQLEAIMAHELGHHVHNDPLWGPVVGMLILSGLAWLVWAINNLLGGSLAGSLGISTLLTLAILPILMAASRHKERQADLYAAKLVRDPQAVAQAFKLMLDSYIRDKGWRIVERPALWIRLLQTHPTMHERIAAFEQR